MKLKKKTVCSTVRIATVTVVVRILNRMYEIGFFGAILVVVVGFVWLITADAEQY